MKELDHGREITLHGPEAADALTRMQEQLDRWGIMMPSIEPLVLDFGLGQFNKTGLIEHWIANETDDGYCGKYLFVFGGQSCPIHHHRQKHETFLIVKGQVKMTYDGETRLMSEGDTLAVPPGLKHGFTGIGPALLLEISTPCVIADNYFQNTKIPIGGNYLDNQA